MKISIEKAKEILLGLVDSHYHSIFTVKSITRDGRERPFNCRLNVTKYLKGGERKYNPADYDLLHVADMKIIKNNKKNNENKTPYRSIRLNTIREMVIGKQHYEIVE